VTAFLSTYLWRHQREIREASAQLRQKAELQVRAVQYLPSDQCLYPHAKTAIGYVFNPYMKTGTLWAPKGPAVHDQLVGPAGRRDRREGGRPEAHRPGRRLLVLRVAPG
jgi:hypothetical protein